MEIENMKSSLDDIPKGFHAFHEGDASILLRYRFSGMFFMVTFLVTWFVVWSIGGYWAIHEPKTEFMLVWMTLWVIAEIAVAYTLLWIFFGRTSLKFEKTVLTVSKKILFLSWTIQISKMDIKKIFQVQDGGEGDDSFPSWGLKISARKTHSLLRKQEYEKSVWLGKLIGKWSGIRFKPVPKT